MYKYGILLLWLLHQTALGESWLAFGGFSGYIEPCGCDPRTDYGGIVRLGAALEDFDWASPWIFDLGNNVSLLENAQIKNQFIIKALNQLKIQGALLGPKEWKLQVWSWPEAKNYPYVLSNASRTLPAGVSHSRHRKSTGIWGYVSPRHVGKNSYFLSWDNFKKRFLKSPHGDSHRILLFSGFDDELQDAIDSKIFTLIISTPFPEIYSEENFDQQELLHPETLLRKSSVYKVPQGGFGLLKGGDLLENTLSLKEILEPQSSKNLLHENLFSHKNKFLWLSSDYQRTNLLSPIYHEYQKALKAFWSEHQKLQTPGSSSPYAGAFACASCHPQAFETWKNSHHSQALTTLLHKNQDHNPDCLGCHVLNPGKSGGFISQEITPHLAGVQCEHCHGARQEHVKNPHIKNEIFKASESCETCHRAPHVGHFSYGEQWSKIRH